MSHPQNPPRTPHPEVVEVTDEDNMSAMTDDPQNYDFKEENVRMSSPELPIAADKCNYNPRLEPTPGAVPPEQQVSSSRRTLDNPPPLDAPSGFAFDPLPSLCLPLIPLSWRRSHGSRPRMPATKSSWKTRS
jgi:hypothetical protein